MSNPAIRATDAKQLLEHPLFKEAFGVIEQRIVGELRLMDTTDERRKRLNDLLVSLAKVRTYIEQIALTGELMAREIERERSLPERIRRAAGF